MKKLRIKAAKMVEEEMRAASMEVVYMNIAAGKGEVGNVKKHYDAAEQKFSSAQQWLYALQEALGDKE